MNISSVLPLIREGRTTLESAFGTFQFATAMSLFLFVGVLMLYSVRLHHLISLNNQLIKPICADIYETQRLSVLHFRHWYHHGSFLHAGQLATIRFFASAEALSKLVGIPTHIFPVYIRHVASGSSILWMVLLPCSILVS